MSAGIGLPTAVRPRPFREAIEDALPSAQRAGRHAAVGRALEALRAAGAEVHLAELAAHFLAAPPAESGAAARYAIAAGEEAIARLGYEDAIGHYRRALTALDRLDPPDPARRVRVLLGVREDVLLNQLVAFAAEPRGHDVDDQDEDRVRSRAAAIVSLLWADAMVIVHDGTVWELATR